MHYESRLRSVRACNIACIAQDYLGSSNAQFAVWRQVRRSQKVGNAHSESESDRIFQKSKALIQSNQTQNYFWIICSMLKHLFLILPISKQQKKCLKFCYVVFDFIDISPNPWSLCLSSGESQTSVNLGNPIAVART